MSHTRVCHVISCDAARKLVDHAVDCAASNGWNVAVAVLDASGHVVASARMDGVPAPVLDFARDKAFTATLGNTSRAFFERMSSSPELAMGASNRPGLCAWDGGLPIMENGTLVGALGVSGAAGPDDIKCAEAALKALGFSG